MSARSWCFTINNPTVDDTKQILNSGYRYVIYGLEKGESGTNHYQGYIEFRYPIKFSTICNKLKRAHIEIRRGTRDEARKYCMKDGAFTEDGNWEDGGSGSRTDLCKVRQAALEGGMRHVTAVYGANQIRIAEKFLTYNEPERNWKPDVTWIHGPTGTGKSKLAHEMCNEDVFRKSESSKWWDGYDGHSEIILDDFRASWMSFTDLLSLLDRYSHKVEVKGGWRQIQAKKIIITSAKHPKECYPGVGEDINQLIRRIDNIVCLDSPTTRSYYEVAGNTMPQPLIDPNELLD